MSFAITSVWDATPGRISDLQDVFREQRLIFEAAGATVVVYRTMVGVETYGQVTAYYVLPTAEARSEFITTKLGQPGPVVSMLGETDPAGRQVARFLVDRIDGGQRNDARNLATIRTFRRVGGHWQAGMDAINAAAESHNDLGGDVRLWTADLAGAATGDIAYVRGFDTWDEVDQLRAKIADAQTLPLFDAVSSGTLAPVSGSLHVRWDV